VRSIGPAIASITSPNDSHSQPVCERIGRR
jgi:hypothetical protein